MRLGAVVTRPGERGRVDRGVVTWWKGRGGRRALPMFTDDDYVIERSAGLYTIGNDVASWAEIPREEWTARERLLSAAVVWEPPDWRGPEGRDYEPDSYEFALLRALLPAEVEERVFGDGDWPCSTEELAVVVGEWLDDALASARTLGTALGRLR